MPIGINSPARNLFLLGSSGSQIVTNFFKTIEDATSDRVFIPDEIKYNSTDEKYLLAGSADDSNNKGFGWLEKRDQAGTADWNVKVTATTSVNTTLRAMELDVNDNLVVVGKTGDIPWIAKYSNGGVIDWQSTTNTADVEYTDVTSDSNGNYYACGDTSKLPDNIDFQAFVEKFDANGNPGWGKSAFMVGRDVELNSIAANNRGEVVAVGHLEDDSSRKGYIVKIDTNTGEVLWDRTLRTYRKYEFFNSYLEVECEGVYIDNKDQIFVVGTLLSPDPNESSSFLVKYSPEGNIIWQTETDIGDRIEYYQVKSNNQTEEVVVFGRYRDVANNNQGGIITKYSKRGKIIWRRSIISSFNGSDYFGKESGGDGGWVNLDTDSSFVYILYTDQIRNNLFPERYTYGKLSITGNGLGNFEYTEGTGETIDYVFLNTQDTIGTLSDGSVRNDTSDLLTYPFNANKLLFDDLATQVSNKKRQMDSADSFEYSGSPAIRPADFQELNLLGDVYSGSGDWLDQSGKGNDGTVGVPAFEPYDNFGSVVFDGTTDWIDFTLASTVGNQFTIEGWFYPTESRGYATIFEFGNHSTGNGILFQTRKPSGVADGVFCRSSTIDISNATISNPYPITLQTWNHFALTFSFGAATLYLNGTSIGTADWSFSSYSATNFRIGASVYGSGSESFPGYISNIRAVDSIVYSSNFTVPSSPLTNIANTKLLTCQGFTIADASSNSLTPTTNGDVVVSGSSGPTHNVAGYWDFDGTSDYINLPKTTALANWYAGPYSIEMWFIADNFNLNSNLKGPLIGLSDLDTSGEWWSLGWNNSSVFNFYYWNGSQQNLTGSTTLSTATWYHAVFTHDSGTIKLYLNGSQDASGSVIGTPLFDLGSQFDLTVGASANGYHDGSIGEVRIYPRALTPAQVFQNYNATREKYTGVPASTDPGLTSTRTPA